MEENFESRVNAEWIAISAYRELIVLSTEGDQKKGTYRNAEALGGEVLPSLLGEEVSILRRARESDSAAEFRQLAQAKSLKANQEISPYDLVVAAIDDLDGLLKVAKSQQKTGQLRKRMKILLSTRDELDPTKHTENQLIIRDAGAANWELPELKIGRNYRDFQLHEDRVLRIRQLHPDQPEQILGADIIYERHNPEDKNVQVAALQYKIWDDRRISVSDKKVRSQLNRMTRSICNQNLCTRGSSENPYRFPYCAAFFRPTDKLQVDNPKLRSTGEHIPICQIDNLAIDGPRESKLILYDEIRHVSLNQSVFEGLFTSGKIGSKSMTHDELSKFYEGLEHFSDPSSLTIFARDLPLSYSTKANT